MFTPEELSRLGFTPEELSRSSNSAETRLALRTQRRPALLFRLSGVPTRHRTQRSLASSPLFNTFLFRSSATVTIFNFQKYRHIQVPGWSLGWTWTKMEVIWSIMGGETTEQGDCSKFKGNIPNCCKKTPTVVDLLQGTPYNQQIANCCKGGVITSLLQDPTSVASAFQLSVGASGTSNKTVKLPKNFTFNTPGPGYMCSPAQIVQPTQFPTADKRRATQSLSC